MIAGGGDDHKRFTGEHEVESCNIRTLITNAHNNFNRSKFNRKYLLEILSNMDSETVTVYMNGDTPILVEGKTEDNIVKGAVAPIIGDEEE